MVAAMLSLFAIPDAKVKHPAKYTDALLVTFARMLNGRQRILDPFGGTGKVFLLSHWLPNAQIEAVEIEPEWAVPPAYSSKTCSQCGSLFAHLTLADRWVECDCGLSLDRDENAARNLLARGQRAWGETWPIAASVPQEAAAL